ncbi:MAG: tetratricopeptide repeat protein [Bacteroidaceae bacterium]|nr:tetratricopeptide repeat protein [Bacteroidaceae bacterium]
MMIRKLIVPVCLLVIGSAGQGIMAQGRLTDRDSRLLDECRTLFLQADYSAAGTLLEKWEQAAGMSSLMFTEETEYIRTVIGAELNPAGSLESIQSFMDKYPESMYSNRMNALLGSAYFAGYDFEKAIECFDETDPLLLDDGDCRRMVRHNAISLIRTGRIDEGRLQLSILEQLIDEPESDADVVFYKAYMNYRQGNFEQAAEGFRNSLDSSHAQEALLYLADIDLNGQGDRRVAYETAQMMIENATDMLLEAEAERILGEYWYRQGEYSKAYDLLKSYMALGISPDPRHDKYILGMTCAQTGDMAGAIENLSEVSEGQDELAQNAALNLGLTALAKGDKSLARMAFERASAIPGKPEVREQALYNYAMIIHETAFSPFAESVTSFERFLNEFPNSKYSERVNSYLVDVYLSTNSYDAALNSIAKINNPGQSILAAKMQLLYNKAMDQMAAGQYNDAPSLLTSVIALDRYNHGTAVNATFWRGEAYYRLNKPDMAENDYRRYLSLIGSRVTEYSGLANYGMGYIAYNRQKYNDAYKSMRTVIDGAAKSGISNDVLADACLRAADCMFYERQYSQAREYYGRALSADRRVGDYALYQTAIVNGLQRNYAQKIRDLETLVNDYPESAYVPSALYEEGRAYQQTDKPTQAVTAFKRIVRDYPTSDLARKASAETALIYYQTNNIDNAIAAYKDVISKYPGSDEAKTAMVDLKSIYVETGDINSYIEYAESVQGAAPIASTERDSLTYTAAEGLFSRGQKDAALEHFEDYLKKFPNGAFAANAWYYQGVILDEKHNLDYAYESYMQAAAHENSRFCESALDRAAVMVWNAQDWETSMDTYIRLYEKTTSAERQNRSLYSIVSSAGKIEEYDAVLQYADKALQAQLSNQQIIEVKYWYAKALLAKNRKSDARPLLEELSKDTRSKYGAESDYLLSQLLFDSGDQEEAEKVIMAFIKEGTPHMYWLARSFILLSDIYKSQGKDVEARQYLLSLQSNYTENDDIAEMIAKRLE